MRATNGLRRFKSKGRSRMGQYLIKIDMGKLGTRLGPTPTVPASEPAARQWLAQAGFACLSQGWLGDEGAISSLFIDELIDITDYTHASDDELRVFWLRIP